MNTLKCPRVNKDAVVKALTDPKLTADEVRTKLHNLYNEVKPYVTICEYSSVMKFLDDYQDVMSSLQIMSEENNALKYFYYGLYAGLFNNLYLKHLDFDTEGRE